MSEDSQRAQRCHQFLSELTAHGTSATSPQGDESSQQRAGSLQDANRAK